MKYIDDIHHAICIDYGIPISQSSIQPFTNTLSQYLDTDRHFILKWNHDTFFIKLFGTSEHNRLVREIKILYQVTNRTKILTPQPCKTISGNGFGARDKYLYIMYPYINSVEQDISLLDTIHVLCDALKELEVIENPRRIYLENRFHSFQSEIKKLDSINKDSQKSPVIEKYLKEISPLATKYYNKTHLDIVFGQFTHGDLIPQNIVFDGKSFWLIDWERSSFAPVAFEAMRSITFSMFDTNKPNLGMNEEYIFSGLKTFFNTYTGSCQHFLHTPSVYLFYSLTNLHILTRILLEKSPVREEMLREDLSIFQWYDTIIPQLEDRLGSRFLPKTA